MTGAPWQAVIDVGTNTALLLVARRGPGGAIEIADDRATITRLGEGVAARGILAPAAISRTLEVLRDYRAVADAAGAAIRAVTTEGVRLAGNPEAFLQPAAVILGAPMTVIDGTEEARLSYLSVALEHLGEGPLRVVDIGGASTEVVCGEGAVIESAISHPIGAVRLTERFITADPPTPASIAAIAAEAREALGHQPLDPSPRLFGLAGTITTAAALLLGLEAYDRERVDRSVHRRSAIRGLRDRLASQPLAARISGVLEAKRADVIVAGLTILLAVMEQCGAEFLVVRDRGLRYALID